MSLKEERLQILKMIEDGQISAAEGARLLAALEEPEKKRTAGVASPTGARWLRVRVTDMSSQRVKVNVNIPLSLASVAMKLGARFAPEMEDLDMTELAEAIQSGAAGRIVEVEDTEDNERVEIFIE
ncbi:MAG: hypothetical protein KKA73_19630 [Chloroflexi bacterium]|nr:hypothetical protein [Chloroflexota bacterium]MBU1749899.1 hypothetical protein [Chloroflexota bacterium]